MVSVVPSTSAEKRKVQMGSTYLYSGWRGWERVRSLRRRHPHPKSPSVPVGRGHGPLRLTLVPGQGWPKPLSLYPPPQHPLCPRDHPDLKEDDVGGDEDTDTLEQVPHDVDEGSADAGVGLLACRPVAVPVPGLVQSNPHPAGRAAVTSPGTSGRDGGHRERVRASPTYTMLTATAQAEVMSMTLPSMS